MHSVVCSVFRSLFFREIFCHFPDQRIARKLRLRLGASQSTIITLFPIRPLGKVNQISTNPRHFPPMIHTLQVLQEVYTGELPETRRESEPNTCKFTALSLGTKLDNRFYGHSACIPRPSFGESEPNSHESWALSP